MPKNVNSTTSAWVDPDEAPAWTGEAFERAEIRHGEKVVKPATGTLTRRGRPKLDDPKLRITLRLDRAVIERFRASGPGWQSRMNEALKKAAGI